jgi:ATP-dependent Lhr-like helicase
MKERLLSEEVILVCMNCRTQRKSSVSNLPAKLKCNKCGGVLLAAIQPYAKAQLDILKRGASDDEERRELRRIRKNADLVMAHGRKAVIARVGRGIGPDTAARILARYQAEEEDFLRDILAAEVTFARTKRFWD